MINRWVSYASESEASNTGQAVRLDRVDWIRTYSKSIGAERSFHIVFESALIPNIVWNFNDVDSAEVAVCEIVSAIENVVSDCNKDRELDSHMYENLIRGFEKKGP